MPNDYGDLSGFTILTVNQETQVTNNLNVGEVITVVGTCLASSVSSVLPAPNSTYVDQFGTSHAGFLLTNSKQENIPQEGGLIRLTLTYTATYTALPSDTFVEQDGVEKVDIQEHPDFSSWSAYYILDGNGLFQGFAAGSPLAGVNGYEVGTTSVIKTQYYSSMPSNGMANIGKLQHPGGDYPGDYTNWKIDGISRAQQNNFWVMVTTYKYSSAGWNTTIYMEV